ncbi:MAG: hypothetical protein HOO87_17570 [Methyloglobulus sp.]|nr:hypothetical protein [Methyloglobulus sp.]
MQKAPVQPGAAGSAAALQTISPITKLFYGLLMGLLSYLVILNREPIIAISRLMFGKAAALLTKKGA